MFLFIDKYIVLIDVHQVSLVGGSELAESLIHIADGGWTWLEETQIDDETDGYCCGNGDDASDEEAQLSWLAFRGILVMR